MIVVSIRSQFATLGLRRQVQVLPLQKHQLLRMKSTLRWTLPKHVAFKRPLLLLQPTMLIGRARPYMNDSDPRRQHQPNRMTMPPWIKPALYAAGGTALLVFAWPVLRFVIIGGLAYGAVKLVRLWISWRQAFSWGRGAVDNVSEFKTLAQLSLQAACLRRDAIVAEILPDSVDDRSITLADATDVQIVGGNRVKAVFPVLIDGQQSGLYVSASGAVAEGVLVEAVSVYTQLRSGQIVEASIEVSSSDGEGDSSSYRGAQRQTKRKVKDAEYKDL